MSLVAPVVCAPIWYLMYRWLGAHTILSMTGMVALLLVVACAYTDLSRHKIPNWATYSGFLWAIVLNVLALAYGGGDLGFSATEVMEASQVSFLGAIGVFQSLFGALGCFFLMLVVYCISRGGAGDVKLAATLGALLGIREGLFVLALTYLLAGVTLLCWTIWDRGPLFLPIAFGRAIGSALLPEWIAPPSDQVRTLLAKPIPLGAFFAVATLSVLLELQNQL